MRKTQIPRRRNLLSANRETLGLRAHLARRTQFTSRTFVRGRFRAEAESLFEASDARVKVLGTERKG